MGINQGVQAMKIVFLPTEILVALKADITGELLFQEASNLLVFFFHVTKKIKEKLMGNLK